MGPVFTWCTCHIDTNEDARICEDREKVPSVQRRAKDQPAKEETPNTRLGYKLGAVSVTMYINSHTSF